MKRSITTWLLAACAAAGCSSDPSTQVVTGSITASNAVTIRAVSNGNVITASRVRSNGSFTLALPAGNQYRLELLSATGVSRIVDASSADITFRVCAPTGAFDMGGVGSGYGGPGDPPPPCDPTTDANCACDPQTGVCKPPPPPPCDPSTDPTCVPPCDPDGGTDCPPICDPQTGDCKPPPWCDPTTDATCATPPPPCTDPSDPTTCKDPCVDDPSTCGCSDPGGWPAPCDGTTECGPEGAVHVAHPPGDFGCGAPGA